MCSDGLGWDAQVTFCYGTEFDAAVHFYEELLGLDLALDQGACRIYRVRDGAWRAAVADGPQAGTRASSSAASCSRRRRPSIRSSTSITASSAIPTAISSRSSASTTPRGNPSAMADAPTLLLVVDVQNGFVNEHTRHVVASLT